MVATALSSGPSGSLSTHQISSHLASEKAGLGGQGDSDSDLGVPNLAPLPRSASPLQVDFQLA